MRTSSLAGPRRDPSLARPPRPWPALPLLAAAYAGGTIAAASVRGSEAAGWTLPLAAALLVGATLVVQRRATPLLVAGALALAGTAYARFEADRAAPPPALDVVPGVHHIEGRVRAEPVPRGRFAHLELAVDRLDGAPAEGGLRVTFLLDRVPPREGDRLSMRGEIEPPPTLEEFDYAAYLRSRGLVAVIAFPEELTITEHDSGPPPARALRALRRALIANIERSLPEPEASLAVGMLLGRQGTLPPELAGHLRATGTTHLVVVSGQNIALVLGTLVAVLAAVIPRRRAALLALAVLPGYVLLVGAEPPVVRAAIMAVGITLGSATGRRTPGWVYLLYAVAAMLALDPGLVESVSFQLSATATAGVIVVAPPLAEGAARLLRVRGGLPLALVEAWATATGALAAVLPVEAAVFEALPLAAIPANVLAAPLYEATLGIAALAAAFGSSDAVADTLWTSGVAAPRLFVDLVAWLAPLGSAALPAREPLLLAVCWYAGLGGLVWLLQARRPSELAPAGLAPSSGGRALAPVALAVVLLGAWGVSAQPAPPDVSITILDVGQGLAVLVRDGRAAALIDAGPPDGSALRALPRGSPRDLKALVITHADLDHAGGAPELQRRLRVARAFGLGADAVPLHASARIDLGGTSWLQVLSPPPEALAERESENDRSLVLLVNLGARRVLVGADIEAVGERWLLAAATDLRADAIVVPHHGSRTSSTPAFIEAVAPALAVVSAGASNQFGHPHPEVVQRYEAAGARVLSTAERGSITLRLHAGALEVTTAR